MEMNSVADVRSSCGLEEDTAKGDLENYRKRGEMENDEEESWDGEIVLQTVFLSLGALSSLPWRDRAHGAYKFDWEANEENLDINGWESWLWESHAYD